MSGITGSKNPNSKLTEADVAKIRAPKNAHRSDADLGKLFGVHRTRINRIRNQRTWLKTP